MLPTPVATAQLNAGCVAWSRRTGRRPWPRTAGWRASRGLALAGLTAMLVSVWLTVTLTLLVVVSPPVSVIVTVKL